MNKYLINTAAVSGSGAGCGIYYAVPGQGCKKRIIVGELINVAGDLHAVVVQKGRYDLIPGKGEIQLCLKEAQNGKGSKADDNLGADCLSNLFRRSCRHSAFGNGKGRFHVCIKF